MSEWVKKNGYRVRVSGARPQAPVQEYVCHCGHRWALNLAGADSIPNSASCPTGCGEFGERAISAPKLGTVYGYAARRGEDEAPPPGCFSTKDIADGKITTAENPGRFVTVSRRQIDRIAVRCLPAYTGSDE